MQLLVPADAAVSPLRVLVEAGVTPASYRSLQRRLPAYAKQEWRQRLSAASAAHWVNPQRGWPR